MGIKQWKEDCCGSVRFYKVICRVEVLSKSLLRFHHSKIGVNIPFTVRCKDVRECFWGFVGEGVGLVCGVWGFFP